MALDPDPKREAILAAAFRVFSLYGFRRTTMDDIARETGGSRAALYTHFANKEEIFRSLSTALHEQALGAAEACVKETGAAPLADRVCAALSAKLGQLHQLVIDSPHANEIMDENSRLCGDVASSSAARFRQIIAAALETGVRAEEIDLAAAGLEPQAAAELLCLAALGLKERDVSADAFDARLAKLVRVFFRGIAAEPRA